MVNPGAERLRGVIKTILPAKRFGFIQEVGTTRELFFHATALEGVAFEDLTTGDAVTFILTMGKPPNENKLRAVMVRRA